mgnify:CR=1 FL=1
MTSVQTMLSANRARIGRGLRVAACAAALAAVVCAPVGCGGSGRRESALIRPHLLVSPYGATVGEVTWAAAPLRNESGTSVPDALGLTDKVVAAAQQVLGLTCLPVNRTLEAMAAVGIEEIRTPEDAEAVASVLGVDGLLVGSITAYDPYDPPTYGLSLALLARSGRLAGTGGGVAPRRLATDGTGRTSASTWATAPASAVSAHLDAKSHDVLMALRSYSQGRHDPDGAFGWRRYTASMELYTEFGSQFVVRRLLEREAARLGEPARLTDSR